MLVNEGELSPLFEATFTYLVTANSQIAKELSFAYLGTEYEIARLEFPLWVARQGLLDKTIEIILHQCVARQGLPQRASSSPTSSPCCTTPTAKATTSCSNAPASCTTQPRKHRANE